MVNKWIWELRLWGEDILSFPHALSVETSGWLRAGLQNGKCGCCEEASLAQYVEAGCLPSCTNHFTTNRFLFWHTAFSKISQQLLARHECLWHSTNYLYIRQYWLQPENSINITFYITLVKLILSPLSSYAKIFFIVYGLQGDNSGCEITNKQINTCVSIMFFGWCHLHLSPVCIVQFLCSNRVLTSAALWHMYWLNTNQIIHLSLFYIYIAFPCFSKDINRFLNQMTLSPETL